MSGERLPRTLVQIDDTDRLPSVGALVENFRWKVQQAASRPSGCIVVFVARVKDTPKGETASVIHTGIVRSKDEFLGALLAALKDSMQAGLVTPNDVRAFGNCAIDVSRGAM